MEIKRYAQWSALLSGHKDNEQPIASQSAVPFTLTLLPYSRWLMVGALTEWLISRTLTRAAIHIPKTPTLITGYQLLNTVGQVAAAFVALLAVFILVWLAWYEWQHKGERLRPLLLIGRVTLSLAFLFIIPSNESLLLHHLLTLALLSSFTLSYLQTHPSPPVSNQLVYLSVVATLGSGVIYQMMPVWYAVLHLPGPAPVTGLLFNLGEGLVVFSMIGLWWVYGRAAAWRVWFFALLPTAFFALLYGRDPAMTGILVIWSTGLSLYLPWMLYATALCLAVVTFLTGWRKNPPVAVALALLAAAGYAPQMSSQLFCALIALWWLARPQTTPAHSSPQPQSIL
jgi:hypothetical protein